MPTITALASEKLVALQRQHLQRHILQTDSLDDVRVRHDGRELVSFSSSNYLGLARHPEVIRAAQNALAEHGAGAGSSRLVSGSHRLYNALEGALAQWKRAESALVCGSGYLANIGLIPALAGEGDLIIADKLSHACMLDGARLSGAKLLRFKHNDAADCRRLLAQHRAASKNCLLLTEGVFSMDGDVPPLAELTALAEEFDATVLCDDAHATGVLNQGHGSAAMGERLIVVGTLSKALGGYGGFVTGPKALIDYLTTAARSLIYSTGLPPASVASASAALAVLQAEPARVQKLHANARLFAQLLGLPEPASAIIPIIIGDAQKAVAASQMLKEQGFLVVAIRPPTVPPGTARLRVTVTAMHEEAHIRALAHAVKTL